MKRPPGGKAFSTRRAVTAVKMTSPLKLTTTSASTTISNAIIAAASGLQRSPCGTPRASLSTPLLFRSRKFHRAVVHAGEPELQHIQRIDLVQPPGPLRPLLWQHVHRPLNIPGSEINHPLFPDPIIPPPELTANLTTPIHVRQHTP